MRAGKVLVVLACVLGVAACGLPQSTPPRVLDATAVPYDLLRADPDNAQSRIPRGRTTSPHVYLLGPGDHLVPVRTALAAQGVASVVDGLLLRLGAGPDDAQRAAGLATALGPDVKIQLRSVSAGTAVISLDTGEQDPSASRLPLAVGQIVLTATSVQGVDRVHLVRGSRPLEVPLPGGALTSSPVSASDYAPLVVRGGTGSGKADPQPAGTG